MPNPKEIAVAIFEGFQILDATGPASVFTTANALSGKELYAVSMVASKPGLVRATGGVTLLAQALPTRTPHTILVSGGVEDAVQAAIRDKALTGWIRASAAKARRYGSICSGAFVLAVAGMLKGKRAATHWAGAKKLQELFPQAKVDPEAIFVVDGKAWTSAGVTTGIDMALAMVEADYGRELASRVARQLVVYMRRPGHQSQFSVALNLQTNAGTRMEKLAAWVEANLDADLSTEALAHRAAMSPRNFHRHLKTALNATPKAWIEGLRLSRARSLLEDNRQGLDAIARAAGYAGVDRLIKAFGRRYGLTPGAYRRLHGRDRAGLEIAAMGD